MTDTQRKNAIELLKRTPLKGNEAHALVEILNLLYSATAESQVAMTASNPVDPSTEITKE
jgi:succinyl-CoA synthetase beta subunit